MLEAAVKELLGKVKTLEFVHGSDLLLALAACVLQQFVLLLNQRNLAFHFIVPALS